MGRRGNFHLTIVETLRSVKNQLDDLSNQLPDIKENPQLFVHQTVNYLDPQKVECFYPHIARVLWMKPLLVDCRFYLEYLKFILKGETVEEWNVYTDKQ